MADRKIRWGEEGIKRRGDKEKLGDGVIRRHREKI
jgi:hypothetical protein